MLVSNLAYEHSCLTVKASITDHQRRTSVYCLIMYLFWVILLMETFIVQLSTSLSRASCSSIDSCRHTVFDYSSRLIGLQEALTQIPTANTEQQENFLLGTNKQRGHQLFSAHKRQQGQPGLSHWNDLLKDTGKLLRLTLTTLTSSLRHLRIIPVLRPIHWCRFSSFLIYNTSGFLSLVKSVGYCHY